MSQVDEETARNEAPADERKSGPMEPRQTPSAAVRDEMMSFMHAPVLVHRERRGAARPAKPPKR